MKKIPYEGLNVRWLRIETQGSILGQSIVDTEASVIIPHGQKVDTYDFSQPTFINEWKVEE